MSVRRIYVEKLPPYAVKAQELKEEITGYLGISSVTNVRILIRYDMENLSPATYEKAVRTIFSEPPVDRVYEDSFPFEEGDAVFSVEYLPGQFDQRADSAEQCVRLLAPEEPVIRSASTYVISGGVTDDELDAIRSHCINPVDSREASDEIPDTLAVEYPEPHDVETLCGFISMEDSELEGLYASMSLAMTLQDFIFIRDYYRTQERRDPTVTEIRVLDTYWSDHCRHTTFQTELKNVTFSDGYYREPVEETYRQYQSAREQMFGGRSDKYPSLMELATMAMRQLKEEGRLEDQEDSGEINACSLVVPVDIDGQTQEWLVQFKNETHNHPTEIEPFGGAATCLGGAIRDPLAGRTYVYQAMRVTGAADPTVPVSETMKGKLPQKKLVKDAAAGYSSYGNQIGLATGYVKEIYHPGYAAKRMEIGAVVGAGPKSSVVRAEPDAGDIIVLLGGRTGRDGIGGATGSSKVHTESSLATCGAEVQKGNAPTERKIQRLFRRPEVSSLILKCNDFGAGGVSVAIGELADGLEIDLDKVPKKYAGLDGTELAISESQERMAVVLKPCNVQTFIDYAAEENLEATPVAVVTESARLIMRWRGRVIVDIDRAFLNTNGAHQETDAVVEIPQKEGSLFHNPEFQTPGSRDLKKKWLDMLSDLNVCSQKGLTEMFDSSIGAGSVLMPYGGKYQLTETQAMIAKLPVPSGHTDTVTMMSYGFDPYLSSWSPYHGAMYAVLSSVAKIVAAGGDPDRIRFTFQEYFQRLDADPVRWGQPLMALLGAYRAQLELGLPSIGGKDSMSGSFNDMSVPPTLVSFAFTVGDGRLAVTPELKKSGSRLVLFPIPRNKYDEPDFSAAMRVYRQFHAEIRVGHILSAFVCERSGLAESVTKMAFGNKLGVRLTRAALPYLFDPGWGNIVAEVSQDFSAEEFMAAARDGENDQDIQCIDVGTVAEDAVITCLCGYTDSDGGYCTPSPDKPCAENNIMRLSIDEALATWKAPLEKVFPTDSKAEKKITGMEDRLFHSKDITVCRHGCACPTVFIPVFPGTNCEYDSARAFERAGAKVTMRVFRNLSDSQIQESVDEFAKEIDRSQIIMFPGGFSAGDEPEGSAKFFATVFRNEKIAESVRRLLEERDGLMLGICNGFQALIKLGLLPYGQIRAQQPDSPTLTMNTIGRHISRMVYTRVMSDKSPWLAGAGLGNVYCNPVSHGEGRFVASDEWLKTLWDNGQVATQYVDSDGQFSMDEEWNVNGSYCAIEGITSPDGRILGKMAHCERRGENVAINIYGEQDMKIFESGVRYFQ